MKQLRVVISLVMLAECCVWVLWGVAAPVHAQAARALQIVPSTLGATLGAGVLWLLLTLFAGRIYCSAFCPVGVLQDAAFRLRQLGPRRWRRRAFRYKPASRRRWVFLALYVGGVVAGIGFIPFLIEPWPVFANITAQTAGRALPHALASLGLGTLTGLLCAAVSAAVLLLYAVFTGRDFCNEVCPLGTVMAPLAAVSAFHIELIPDRCNACLRCQDVCKVSCISIPQRRVDNARCVRCFNCIAACDQDAIRFTANRNGIITPLFQRRSSVSN